jgi:hypothetical protein
MIDGRDAAKLAFQAIHAALAADERTREPMNALAVWTELGRGLAGTLEKKGASPGLLREVIDAHCGARSGGPNVDLAAWAYTVAAAERLTRPEIAAAMRRVLRAIEDRLPELSAAAETSTEKERDLYIAIVRGWFPVGLDIVRALPRGERATSEERLAALGAWCAKYLPSDASAPRDLGIRVER